MRRLPAVALVVTFLVCSVPVAPAIGVHDGGAVSSTVGTDSSRAVGSLSLQSFGFQSSQTLGTQGNFDSVEFHITVYENGTAGWRFVYQRTLENESERRQFEAFADDFENDSTDLYAGFERQASRLTSAGQNVTGREMAAQNFDRKATVGGLVNEDRGVVEMSFQWTSFASADEGTIIVGDVFEGGLYIGPNQSLVVHAGPGLEFTSVAPSGPAVLSGDTLAGSDSVTWGGKRDFTDQRPRVRLRPTGATTTATAGGSTSNGATTMNATQPPAGGSEWSPLMVFIAAVVVLLGLAAAFAWRQGDFGSFENDTSNPGSGSTPQAEPETDDSPEPSVSDEELLTDEARVKKLLDENGGRMKQVNIVEDTGWSKSKVSMLLSEMEEEGDISKLRVGRENIISLEGHEPDAAGSPLEE